MNSRSTRCRCRRLAISSQSRHSLRTVPTNHSATAFAFGALTGVWMTRMPSAWNTVSNARVNLPSLSRTNEEPQWSLVLGEREDKVPRLLGCPDTVRVLAHAGEVHAPGRELDKEQHVDPPQRDRLDREKVARDHALSLAPDELAPGRPTTSPGRSQPRVGKDLADARRGDLDPEPCELACDPPVPPSRVLPREAQHQRTNTHG